MQKLQLILLCLLSVAALNAQTYNIKDFGAVTDTSVLNTKAIQAAIDKCNADGGGEVLVPAGKFFSGTVLLKSNVYLHLLAGAVLQGSYSASDYLAYNILPAKKFGTITHDGVYDKTVNALVIADNASYTGIIGQGTLKGAGEGKAFQLGLNKDGKPKNIFFVGCTHVILKDFTILNSAQVTIAISKCEIVNIDGIYINSIVNWNGDGLDVDAKDATISNCIIESEDDALCFKSEYPDKFCENITVNNCVLSSLCNGIKLGTGSRAGFRNITVTNCVIKKSPVNGYRHWKMTPDIVYQPEIQSVNTGIVILGVDGGVVENINFSNIIMTDVLSPFFIRIGRRFLNSHGKPSIMQNINISHVRAESRSIIPSIFAGLDDSWIKNIKLSDIDIHVPISVSADSLKNFPIQLVEDTKGYPENRLVFGSKLPSSAFYVRHVKGLIFNNISVTYAEKDFRPALYFDESGEIRLKGILIGDNRLKQNDSSMLKQNKSEKLSVVD